METKTTEATERIKFISPQVEQINFAFSTTLLAESTTATMEDIENENIYFGN